jgi:hypothetical protein
VRCPRRVFLSLLEIVSKIRLCPIANPNGWPSAGDTTPADSLDLTSMRPRAGSHSPGRRAQGRVPLSDDPRSVENSDGDATLPHVPAFPYGGRMVKEFEKILALLASQDVVLHRGPTPRFKKTPTPHPCYCLPAGPRRGS